MAAKLGVEAAVMSCFEAGRDGFWLHRLLSEHGVINHVVEPTSILVNRRARHAKTDRLDAQGLLQILAAHAKGDHDVCSVDTMLDLLRASLTARKVAVASIPSDLARNWMSADGRARIEVAPAGDARFFSAQ